MLTAIKNFLYFKFRTLRRKFNPKSEIRNQKPEIAPWSWKNGNNSAGGIWQIGVIPANGGQVTPLPIYGNASTTFEWSADSKAILGIRTEDGVSTIWRFPLDGAKPVKMTNFTKSLIYNLDLAPDGRRLAPARGAGKSDVILIQATNSSQ